jgi:hypothetical protein
MLSLSKHGVGFFNGLLAPRTTLAERPIQQMRK